MEAVGLCQKRQSRNQLTYLHVPLGCEDVTSGLPHAVADAKWLQQCRVFVI